MQEERRWLAVSAIGLSLFLSALDGTIVALALPQIAQQVRDVFFSSQAAQEVVQFCFEHMQSESLGPTQQFKHFPSPENGGPRPTVSVLIIGAGRDKMVPPQLVKATAAAYGTTPIMFPRMGHDLMLDVDHEEVAATLMDWIEHLPGKGARNNRHLISSVKVEG